MVPRQLPTQNQQLRPSYTHYYVGAETTFQNLDHLHLWNVLVVELLSVENFNGRDELKNGAFKYVLSFFITEKRILNFSFTPILIFYVI